MDPFAQLLERTERLARRRRAWLWAGQALTTTLLVTVLYLVPAIPGWLPAPGGGWVVAFNLLVTLGAAWAGYRRPVALDRVLFHVDQALKTGELLLTLHDLKRRGEHDFIPLLERRLVEHDVRPERVYLRRGINWKRGGTIAALALVCLVLWFGMNTTWVSLRQGPAPGSAGPAGSERDLSQLPPELQSRLERVKKFVPTLPDDLDGSLSRRLLEPRARLRQLISELGDAQDQVLGLSPGAASQPGGEPADPAGLQRRRERQRQRLEQLQQQLQDLQDRRDPAEGSGNAAGQEWSQAIRQTLQELGQDSPWSRSLEQTLGELASADPTARRLALEKLQQDLNQRLQADQDVAALRRALDRLAPQPPASDPETAASPLNASPSEGASRPTDESGGPGSTPAGGRPAPGRSGPAQDPSQGVGQSAGEEAGNGPAGEGSAAPAPPRQAPTYKNAQVPDNLVPATPTARWLTRGVPVETRADPGAGPGYRLSYDRVEALLDLRDLPVEVQDVVRSYFLGLIGQLNEE